MFLDGRLDLEGGVLLAKALAALVDHHVPGGVLQAVDVGGPERAFKVLHPLDGEVEDFALADRADMLAGGVQRGELGLAFGGETLLIGERLADDLGLLLGEATAVAKVSGQLVQEVEETAVAAQGEGVGAEVAVVIPSACEFAFAQQPVA